MIIPVWFAVFVWIGFLAIIAFTILTILHLFRNTDKAREFLFWLVVIVCLPVIGSLIYLETTKIK